MSGASLRFRLPPASLFKFPPDPEPAVLPAPSPTDGFRSFAAPFNIDQGLYNAVFSPYVPITIASVYAVTVLYMNGVNRERGGKPWAISRTSAFHVFVILHNVGLAIFSGLVFWAMMRALAHTWPSYREYGFLGKLWPGIRTQNGLAGAADALCKLHGPRGFGDAAIYNTKKGLWEVRNKIVRLGVNGKPDPSDLGRIWNEGLAFWGWFFYLSKFYEVVDTAIILLKGKSSSTLQTYHHTGAMFCMWAGMRYMSPPIWMFVWYNAGIHAMMYTYYTLSALGIKVPRRLKKTLTTMQIGQFLVGFTFAVGHYFVEYTLPSHISYAGKHGIKSAASAVSAAAATIATAVTDPTATAGAAAWLKKLAYRAAGEEGLAENVRNQYGEVFGPEADHVQSTLEQMRRRPTYEAVNCIDTTGQSFAIWLNLIYLAPLTWLFVRFFYRSYSRRVSVATTHPTQRNKLSKSAEDAGHGVERKVDSIGRSAENGLSELAKKAKEKSTNEGGISETVEDIKSGLSKGYEQVVEMGKHLGEQVMEKTGNVKDMIEKRGEEGVPNAKSVSESINGQAQDLADRATEATKRGVDTTKDQLQQGSQQVQKGAEKAKQKAKGAADKAKDTSQSITDDVSQKASEAKDAVKDQSKRRKDSAKDTTEPASSKVGRGQEGDDNAQGPEDSGVLVERHNDAAETSEKRAESEGAVASPPAKASANGSKSKGDSKQGKKEKQPPTSDGPVTKQQPQGLSTTDSRAPDAKSYADELK